MHKAYPFYFQYAKELWGSPIMSGMTVCSSCPAPTGHHSFFSASAGLVRAARRVCQRTEAMVTANEIRTQRM